MRVRVAGQLNVCGHTHWGYTVSKRKGSVSFRSHLCDLARRRAASECANCFTRCSRTAILRSGSVCGVASSLICPGGEPTSASGTSFSLSFNIVRAVMRQRGRQRLHGRAGNSYASRSRKQHSYPLQITLAFATLLDDTLLMRNAYNLSGK